MTNNLLNIEEMILQHPNEVLLQKADKVKIEDVKEILIAMKNYISEDENGAVGLALPQIGISQRAFVAKVEYLEKGKKKNITEIFINPVIQVTNSKPIEFVEGCLSLKDETYIVKRPKAIKVIYKTLQGKTKFISLSGFDARVVLHENDHLNGVLISEIGTRLSESITA